MLLKCVTFCLHCHYSDSVPFVWDVNTLEFYETSDCVGTKVTGGVAIASGSGKAEHFYAMEAFDDDEDSIWGGRHLHNYYWIGMDFMEDASNAKMIKCVKITDNQMNAARSVSIQSHHYNDGKGWRLDSNNSGSDLYPLGDDGRVILKNLESTASYSQWRIVA